MMSRYLIAATLVALAAHSSSAAPIAFNGWVVPGDKNSGRTVPGAQVDFGNDYDLLPIRANIRGDDQTGHVDILQWDVYSTDRSLLAYSLPPQSVEMTFGTVGWGGFLDTPDGDWRVILWPRYTIQGNDWRLQVHTDLPLNGPYLSDRPNLTSFELKVLAISPDRVTVSARGLYRVVLQPGNEVIRELLSKERADNVVDTYNGCEREQRAEAVSYEAWCQRESN